jgi:histidinol-phosphate aminotransferase
MTMSPCDLSASHIRAIAPYQPGKPISELQRELGLRHIVKLASNENPLGPSPMAVEAMQGQLESLALYPDGNGFGLKRAIALRFEVGHDQIVLGNGSNDILEFAARAFLGPGTSAVYSQHAFAVYPLATQTVGARGIEVPARDFGSDLAAMVAAIAEDTRVLFIANPNNPTGTFIPGSELLQLFRRVPPQVLIVLDEAYTEYLSEGDRYDSVAWLAEFPNLLISRTFSKAYGLAGLRVGFGIAAPPLIDLLNRVRPPFNVNTLGLIAAEAALADADYLARGVAINRAGMLQIISGLRSLGLDFIPSWGNFLAFRVGDGAGVYGRLLNRGVIVRPVANYGLPEWLRVSIGLAQENATFLAALGDALERRS